MQLRVQFFNGRKRVLKKNTLKLLTLGLVLLQHPPEDIQVLFIFFNRAVVENEFGAKMSETDES